LGELVDHHNPALHSMHKRILQTSVSCLGMLTVTVQYGPDGSVVRLPYPCRWQLNLNHKTDGRWDGQHPSNTVPICPSTALDGFGRESLNLRTDPKEHNERR
jgi:hypothetical protein